MNFMDGRIECPIVIAALYNGQGGAGVNVGHEFAFKYPADADNLRACRFTLRAVVKIAQDVVHIPSMKYD